MGGQAGLDPKVAGWDPSGVGKKELGSAIWTPAPATSEYYLIYLGRLKDPIFFLGGFFFEPRVNLKKSLILAKYVFLFLFPPRNFFQDVSARESEGPLMQVFVCVSLSVCVLFPQ